FRIETSAACAVCAANGEAGAESGRRVRLTISDTGCGMDERVRERAFEPFFTTKGVGKGTGLGLSTVYGIVQQNEGTILVSSQPGQGTVFEIDFPVAPQGEPEDAISTRSRTKADAGVTILVVEDEPDVRSLVREILGQLGYTVLEAGDGYEALKLVEEGKIEI